MDNNWYKVQHVVSIVTLVFSSECNQRGYSFVPVDYNTKKIRDDYDYDEYNFIRVLQHIKVDLASLDQKLTFDFDDELVGNILGGTFNNLTQKVLENTKYLFPINLQSKT